MKTDSTAHARRHCMLCCVALLAYAAGAAGAGAPADKAAAAPEEPSFRLTTDEARALSLQVMLRQADSVNAVLTSAEKIARHPEAADILLQDPAGGDCAGQPECRAESESKKLSRVVDAVARTGGFQLASKDNMQARIDAMDVRLNLLVDQIARNSPAERPDRAGDDGAGAGAEKAADPLQVHASVLGYIGGPSPRVTLRHAGRVRVVYPEHPFQLGDNNYVWRSTRSLTGKTGGLQNVRLTFLNMDTRAEVLRDWPSP